MVAPSVHYIYLFPGNYPCSLHSPLFDILRTTLWLSASQCYIVRTLCDGWIPHTAHSELYRQTGCILLCVICGSGEDPGAFATQISDLLLTNRLIKLVNKERNLKQT